MTEQRELELRAFVAARRIVNRAGAKRRAAWNGWCYVSWRDLDALADALRDAGVLSVDAPSLGSAVADRMREALESRRASR